jgi:hypothetical protein
MKIETIKILPGTRQETARQQKSGDERQQKSGDERQQKSGDERQQKDKKIFSEMILPFCFFRIK